jgi:molybdate transport repressor ModE-like protein
LHIELDFGLSILEDDRRNINMQKDADNARLVPGIAWSAEDARGDGALDPRLLPMLRRIAAGGTLGDAAEAAGIAYRSAWGLFDDAERALRAPLLELSRGRGARLSALGRTLVDRDREARAWLERRQDVLAVALPGAPAKTPPRALRIVASHDLALAELREAWHAEGVADVQFKGSLDSLADYVRGDADLAGFHVARDAAWAAAVVRLPLDPARDAAIPFLVRAQGLLLPKGNPRRVRSLADVAAKGLRFVNRQQGSGTRAIVDALLERDGIAASGLAGYANEEFTHAAVAATVASGGADAGVGVQAAATRHGLAFVPLLEERYLFACRRDRLQSPAVRAFRRELASARTRSVVAALPGYAIDVAKTAPISA